MAPLLDNLTAAGVAEKALDAFAVMFPGERSTLLGVLFTDVEAMFAGSYLDYQKIDTPYHDLQHTLQVTLCFIEMMSGRHAARIEPPITARQFELGVSAALLHDTGYLKLRADLEGTGAKYTFTHVLRSCAVASSYLPSIGVSLDELDGVLGAIRCTNPSAMIRRLHFEQPIEGIVGCAVATADYIGQMSAPNYLAQLPLLFAEFEESDNFAGVPAEQRPFRSVDELIAKTPLFWRTAVLPKLENELLGLYRFLARPYPDGPNAYIEAVNQNIAAISAEGHRRSSQTASSPKV